VRCDWARLPANPGAGLATPLLTCRKTPADAGIPAFTGIACQPYMDEDAMTAYSDDPGYIPIMSVSHRTCDRRRVQVSVSRVYR